LLELLLGRIARDGGFHHLALGRAVLLGARDQVLAHLAQELLGRGGARLHRLEPQGERIAFALAPLVGLIDGGGELVALLLGGRQRGLDLLDA
jgi:hypothetical protein